jgi:hypothetical protein
MSISESYTERLEKDLKEITGPLVQQLKDIDGEIEEMTTELSELRAHRQKLVTIVRQIDPELAPPKKVYPAKSKSLVPVNEETVEGVLAWVKLHKNGDEFYASGLKREPHFPNVSQSQLSKALNVLHDRGQIRLVRSGSGGSKYYKTVTA